MLQGLVDVVHICKSGQIFACKAGADGGTMSDTASRTQGTSQRSGLTPHHCGTYKRCILLRSWYVYLLLLHVERLHETAFMKCFASQTSHDDQYFHTLVILPFYPKRRGSEIRSAVEPHACPASRRIPPSPDWPDALTTRTNLPTLDGHDALPWRSQPISSCGAAW
jgi:hypothetical protein